jgi:Sugar kinases, ribokinase family
MTVVALGELLLRLKSPGNERLLQSAVLEATIGGAEANVVSALAMDGIAAGFVSVVPSGPIGDAALGELRRHGVDVSRVMRTPGRLGVYYLEAGAGHRPSRVVYDRVDSTMALAPPSDFDWTALLAGVRWLHVSGITPAISPTAAEVTRDAVRAASRLGVVVSVDFNHRAALWKWGASPADVMPGILEHASIGIAGREDIQSMLGMPLPGSGGSAPDPEAFAALARSVLQRFPSMRMQAITIRESESASRNGWSALLRTRDATYRSRRWEITDMVDRIGAGDAFSAGLIHALLTSGESSPQRAIEFATAASCLKHTIPGDVNRVRAAEVDALLAGDGTGRVQR